MNHVDEVFSFTSKVRFYGASFRGREEGICSKSVRDVRTSSTVFATTERTRRKLGIVGEVGVELKGSLAVTSKSRRLGERRKATTGGCWKTLLQRLGERSNKLKCFLIM